MKKIFFSFVLSIVYSAFSHAQENPAPKLANYIANAMKDSLGLTDEQTIKIYEVNMELHRQKTEARSKSQEIDIIGKELQRIESTRDSLYKEILNEEQYAWYLKKKVNLVRSANTTNNSGN